ncbi:hypothetical protein Q4485_07455 [Granulosicoccaceae sp. 1_MG-2023]|nr:hypothetical protein [Granulosicoccaceae sp. 1_MG-2023]
MLSLAQKRSRLLLGLTLLLLVLLGLGSVFFRSESTPHLSTLNSADASELHFELADGRAAALQKRDDGWYLTAPWQRRADASRVQVLLTVLTLPAPVVYSPDELAPAEAGLDKPAGVLNINGTRFEFGRADATQRRRYVRSGDRIALLSDLAFPVMQQGADYLADKQIFPPGMSAISTPAWQLEKTDGLWRSATLSTARAETLVGRWLAIRAAAIVAWPLPAGRLPDSTEAIRVEVSNGSNTSGYSIYRLPDLTLIHRDDADHALAIEADAATALLEVPGDA